MARASLTAGLLALCASGALAPRLGAQESGSIAGTVRAEAGEAVPHAVVALVPSFSERFTDDSGGFLFAQVPPGVYRLAARQVGFRPLDTTLVVAAGSRARVTVTLRRLVVRLSEVAVVTTSRCRQGGPPDPSAGSALVELFDQLRQNAERYRLLADSYPVFYRMERTLGDVDASGAPRTDRVDSVDLRTDARVHYHVGRVVTVSDDRSNPNALQLNLPTLPDFADSGFQQAHCFYLAGLDTLDGGSVVRMDFAPVERSTYADVAGSVYLDSATYQVRRAVIRLTRVDRVMPGLASVAAIVSFREIAPSVVLVDRIRAENRIARYYLNAGGADTEEQRLVAFRFLRPLPGRP